MKLIPDSVSSRLGKIPVVGRALSSGGPSDENESESDTPVEHQATDEASGSPDSAPSEPKHESTRADSSAETEEERPEAAGDEDDHESSAPGDGDEQNADDSDDSDSSGDSGEDQNDANDITAPSIGPNTVINHEPPEERLDHDKISNTDVMGLDKRREVVGKRYSASPARQLVIYALFIVVVAAAVIGGKALATNLDKPDAKVKDEAPWTGSERPPEQLDFPQYGEPAS